MSRIVYGLMVGVSLGFLVAAGFVSGQVATSAGAAAASPSAVSLPPASQLLASMAAAIHREGSAHLTFEENYFGQHRAQASLIGSADISSRLHRARVVETFGYLANSTDSLLRHTITIDVARYRARRFDNSRWACTLEKDSYTTRYNLSPGLQVHKAVTIGTDTIGNVRVWHVTATVTGSQHDSGTASFYIAQSTFTLRRLIMATVVGPARRPIARLKHRFDYSHWGEPVNARLPQNCPYFGVTSAEIQPFGVEGQSMEPNYHALQTVWVDTQFYLQHPARRGDVIVFRGVPGGEPNSDFIKRIVGLPGETIAIHNNSVYINTKPLHESYRRLPMDYSVSSLKIPPNDYFVLGDNRDNSDDSHIWKWLPRNDIIGKVVL